MNEDFRLIGTKVSCRLYNVPEDRYYGKRWVTTIKGYNPEDNKGRYYLVERHSGYDIWVTSKEIKFL